LCLLLAAESVRAAEEPAAAAPAPSAPAAAPDQGAPPEASLVVPKPSQGYFLALGLHGTSALAFDHHRSTRSPTFGAGFSLRVGEALTDWLDLSLAFAMAQTEGAAKDRLTYGRFGIHSQWYVWQEWFVQAGLGATSGRGPDPEDLERQRGRYGDVYWAGIGKNLYLSDGHESGGWVLTPAVALEVGPDKVFTTTGLWLGVEISFWSGLSRDKLELPVSEAYEVRSR
jgi:hypothetical protein